MYTVKLVPALFAAMLLASCSGPGKATSVEIESPAAPPVHQEVLDRSQPPVPGPAPEIKLGDYRQFVLDNGLTVFVVENDKLPRVSVSLIIDKDPGMEEEKAGLAEMAGELLAMGTTSRSKADLDEEVDFTGAYFSTSSRSIRGSALSRHSETLMELMSDVLLNPLFPQEELDKLVTRALSDLAASKEEPGSIAGDTRRRVVFGPDHPYGEVPNEATVQNITREDVIRYFDRYWSPGNAYMALVGDIMVEQARDMVGRWFGAWEETKAESHEYPLPKGPDSTMVILVDRPVSVQSEIRVSYPVVYRSNQEDFFAARLMNLIFGQGISSRLMQNLREDKGYTYDVYSMMRSSEVVSSMNIITTVRNDVTDSAIAQILSEMAHIVAEGVTEDELRSAKAFITGSFARSLESPQTIAGLAVNVAIEELPVDYYHDYLKHLNAVTVDEVNRAAASYIRPDNAYIIVVGKAAEIAGGLAAFGPVMPYAPEDAANGGEE